MSGANSVHCSAAAIAFDRVADSYDELFTRTAIGRAQRAQVWTELLKVFHDGERILELNCGTGEDARFLAQNRRFVTACDASAGMITVAKSQPEIEPGSGLIRYLQIANEELNCLPADALYDGVFSNFSGLNCISDWPSFAQSVASVVRPGGRVLICLWSRICLAEIVWFLLHGQFKKAFRRFAGKPTAKLGALTIQISYPSASRVERDFLPWFRLEKRKAVGLFVPPSYVEPWVQKNRKFLSQLEKLDSVFAKWPMLRDMGDHVLMEFVRCPQ